MACPNLTEYVPATQSLHSVAPLTSDHRPVPHSVHVVLELAPMACEKVPSAQRMQAKGDDCAGTSEYVPAPHLMHWSAVVMPETVEYVPAGHGLHVLLSMAPCSDEKYPGPHPVQLSGWVSMSPVENVPAGQLEHCSGLTSPVWLLHL